MDTILNGQAHGTVASMLMAHNMDPGALRPYVDDDGRSYITVNKEGKPTVQFASNAATLRKDQWIAMDQQLIKVAKPRLKAWADLRATSQFIVPGGMGKTTLEYEDMSDIGPATISMDGLRKGENDRPVFDLKGLPLPIIHKDFGFSVRQLMTSRQPGGTPLDMTNAELAARRVAEEAENLTLGLSAVYSFGGYNIYGYTNFPSRITRTITSPVAGGWTPVTTLSDVLNMKQDSHDAYHYGPWALYCSPAWDKYMDGDFSAAKGDLTLRERLAKITGISKIQTLDYLTGYTLLLVEQNPDVARAVVGMDMTTIQWETHGGLYVNFKVMCIFVPQLRTDQDGNTGIVHGAP